MHLEPHDPEDRESAYALWLGESGRNVSDVARRLGLPRTTIQTWHDRDRWQERAALDDRALVRDRTGDAWRRLALTLPEQTDILLAPMYHYLRLKRAAMLGLDPNDPCNSDVLGPALPLPDSETLKQARTAHAYFGIAAQKTIALSLSAPAAASSVSDDELDALLAAGDIDALLALSMGKPLPLPGGAEEILPGDFTSGQPGGRVVPEPSSPVPPARKPKPVDPFEAVWKASSATSSSTPEGQQAEAADENSGTL